MPGLEPVQELVDPVWPAQELVQVEPVEPVQELVQEPVQAGHSQNCLSGRLILPAHLLTSIIFCFSFFTPF